MNHLSFLFPSRRLVLAVATFVACAIGVGVLTGAGGSASVGGGGAYYYEDPYYPNPYPSPYCDLYNNSPTADFTYSPAVPKVGEQVTFTSTSTDPDGDALTAGWDFNGDWNPTPGNIDFAHIDRIGNQVQWTFDQAGDHRVRMGVQDSCGASDLIDQTVRVEAAGDGGGGGGGGGQTGGGAGAGGVTQDTTGPTIVVAAANKTRRASPKGVFTFVVGPFAEDVTGTIRFESVDAVVSQRRRKKLRLAAKAISVAKGERLVVRTKLPRKGRRALRRRKRIRMRARIVLRDSLGNATTRNYRFTLKAPRRKRR